MTDTDLHRITSKIFSEIKDLAKHGRTEYIDIDGTTTIYLSEKTGLSYVVEEMQRGIYFREIFFNDIGLLKAADKDTSILPTLIEMINIDLRILYDISLANRSELKKSLDEALSKAIIKMADYPKSDTLRSDTNE